MNIVPRVWTPAHVDALRLAIHSEYHNVFGECPGDLRTALFWAHCIHEHGWDQRTGISRGISNWNIGNIDASRGTTFAVFSTVPEREVIDGAETKRVHTRLAFDSLEAGVRAYWERMRDRYSDALKIEQTHVLAAYLKRQRYYTGSEAEYVAALAAHIATYRRRYHGDDFETFCGWVM